MLFQYSNAAAMLPTAEASTHSVFHTPRHTHEFHQHHVAEGSPRPSFTSHLLLCALAFYPSQCSRTKPSNSSVYLPSCCPVGCSVDSCSCSTKAQRLFTTLQPPASIMACVPPAPLLCTTFGVWTDQPLCSVMPHSPGEQANEGLIGGRRSSSMRV